MNRRAIAGLSTVLLVSSCGIAAAQLIDRVSVRALTEVTLPIAGDDTYYTAGFLGTLSADFAAFPFLLPFVQAGAASEPLKGADSLAIAGAGLGIGYLYPFGERLVARLDGLGGYYVAARRDVQVGNFFLGGRAEAGFRVSPSLMISASAGVLRYFGRRDPLLTAATAGLSATLRLGGLGGGGGKVKMERVRLENIFPVFYSFYDDHPFGSVSVFNGEEAAIRDVRVSFSMSQYMDQPKVCATVDAVARGGSVEVPLYAIFNDQVLSLTENTRVPAEIVVDYSIIGSRRQERMPFVLQFYHRNAMSWDDDRRAAAFVSPTDPAALWFGKYVTGIVRDRLRMDLNRNLQLAIGLFEAEKLYGINYVVDPSSSYVEKSASGSAVDYLQYPHQTLAYRGGDCDDLSILYSALLESVGIQTAFITIPGHIFMAFSLDMSEKEARGSFFDPAILIYRDGRAWVPVEITMIKEGFVKAWRIGAKEWADNSKSGNANFYPMADSWKLYSPVGIPDVNPRFTLPDEALAIRAFDDSVNRFIAKEIDPAVQEYHARLREEDSPYIANELGILYGRYGMLKEARAQFSRAANSGYTSAVTNLGNIAFLDGDYKLAITYYTQALVIDPEDSAALLGMARSNYELEHFTEAEQYYSALKFRDLTLAARYGYLESMFGGVGRAWSYTERLANTIWGKSTALAAFSEETLAETEPVSLIADATPQAVETAPIQASVSPAAISSEEEAKPAPSPPAEIEAAAGESPAAVSETPREALEESATPGELFAEESGQKTPQEPQEAAVEETEAAPAVMAETQSPTAEAEKLVPLEQAQGRGEEELLTRTESPILAEGMESQVEEAPIPEVGTVRQAAEAPPPAEKAVSAAAEAPSAQAPEIIALTLDSSHEPLSQIEGETHLVRKEGKQLLSGFAKASPALGTWSVSPTMARQAARNARFAKLVTRIAQSGKHLRFSFTARAEGEGWVGLGLHLFVVPAKNYRGYGAGKSLLVWLTRDPKRFGDEATRLQVYRSRTDVRMTLLKETVIPESVSDSNSISIETDPSGGLLSISLNGRERLRFDGLADFQKGTAIIFRALNRARFEAFTVEELQ